MKELQYHCKCQSPQQKVEIRDELRIRAAINKITIAEYLIKLFKKTKREL